MKKLKLDIQRFTTPTPYIQFQDYPNTNTPLSSANLNSIQVDIKQDIADLSDSLQPSTEYTSSSTKSYSASFVNSQFDVISRTINFGSTYAGFDKYDQTSTVSIPSGYEAIGIVGYSLTGTYFTWINVVRLYISGTTVYWSISNPGSHDTGDINCDIKILVRKTS